MLKESFTIQSILRKIQIQSHLDDPKVEFIS